MIKPEDLKEFNDNMKDLQKQVTKLGNIVKENVKRHDEVKSNGKSLQVHQINGGMVITCEEWTDADYDSILEIIKEKQNKK